MARETRMKIPGVLLLLLVAGAALLANASPSPAAQGKPPGFYGVVLANTPSPQDWDTMEQAGVGSVRLAIPWQTLQPSGHGPIDWRSIDEVVGPAAGHGIAVLPFLGGTPQGLASDPTTLPIRTAGQREAWASFLRAAVSRYGPNGDFWSDPYTPYLPIRTWQIWNEQNTPFFARPVSPKAYDRLLNLSSLSIRAVDPGADVLIGGMLGRPAAKPPEAYPADQFVDKMYSAGSIRGSFSGVGLHPYSEKVPEVGVQAKAMRKVFARHHDRRKTLAITEITWGAGPRGSGWLEEGPAGQAQRLTQMYRMFYAHRNSWRVTGVYWFSWRSHASVPQCVFCRTSGLLNLSGNETPALHAFESLAR